MPQKSYYHFWYESYSEKKSEITFWEFIELLRRHNIPTLAFDLYQAYAHFFSDHPTEKECRLTAETQDFMEAIQSDGYPSFFERSNHVLGIHRTDDPTHSRRRSVKYPKSVWQSPQYLL